MRIITDVSVLNSVYRVDIAVPARGLTPAEREQIEQLGEPVIDFGGAFNGSVTRPGAGSPTAVSFVLNPNQRRLISQLPLSQQFSLDDTVNADVYAQVFKQTIEQIIQAARVTLMSTTLPFVADTNYTVTNSMPTNNSLVSQEGVATLSNNTSQVTITFPTAFGAQPTAFTYVIYNNSADSVKQVLTPYLISANNTTLVVGWGTPTNSGNYVLSWTAKIV